MADIRESQQPASPDEESRSRRTGMRQGLGAAFVATVTVTIAAAAIVFAIADGTKLASDEGTIAVMAEASLSAAAATYNGVVQAQVIAEAADLGVATADDLEPNLRQIERASSELTQRTERLLIEIDDDRIAAELRTDLNLFVDRVDLLANQISAGEVGTSADIIEGQLETVYVALASTLAGQRDAAMAQLALAGEDAGRLADAARFIVVLLVPAVVLLAYRRWIRRDQQRRDLEHQLEKQQAVSQAQDEFIANLSHELRTPLTAIYGFSLELIEPAESVPPALARELATYIASESADLSRMVEDILTAASADQGGLVIALQDVDPAKEVTSVVGPMRATGAQIQTRMNEGSITCDPLRFRQIIRNLASNALRHGGPHCSIVGYVDDTKYVVEVRDDGRGIPEKLENRLFTRFIHRGEEPLLTGSVGLGLAIAHLLAKRTGARLSYRREDGDTVFAAEFPLAASFLRDEGNAAPHEEHGEVRSSHFAIGELAGEDEAQAV